MKTRTFTAASLTVHARTIATTRHLLFRRAWLWTGFLAFATIAFGPRPAQAAATEAWVQRYGSEAGSQDSAYQVVTDAAGNVIVAGSPGIIKYSGAGVPLWTNRSGGAVAVDASGNMFVTETSIGSGGNLDYATIKYSGAGVPMWTNHYNGSSIALKAVDASGNVFVTGTSIGTVANSDYVTIGYSGAGVPMWTNRYNGPGNWEDQATGIAVDGSGNVFVTGRSAGSGGGDFPLDYATIAYSGAGVPLWTNRYNGPSNSDDGANAVAVDGSGNVLVTGYSGYWNRFDWIYDYTTIAYSGAGVPLWTRRYRPGNGPNQPVALAVDASGNVFVTGRYYPFGSNGAADSATIAYSGAGVPLWTKLHKGSTSALAVDGSGNVLVAGDSTIKYSGAGVPLWTNLYTGAARGVAVDASGNVFVAGYSVGSGGDSDYVTIAYSGAGVPLWTDSYGGRGPASDIANAVAVDASGNVFVTGYSYGVEGYEDYATIAYSGAGVPLWTNRYNGPGNGSDIAIAMAVDRSGNVFVMGTSVGRGGDGEIDGDYATIAYSGAGVPLWTNRYNGSPSAIAVDGSGNVFVTGSSGYCLDGLLIRDYATIAYSGVGVPLWTNRYNGPADGSDKATAVAVDGSGNVFVTGYSYDGGFNNAYATIAYSGAGVPLWTNRYGPGLGDTQPSAVAVDASGNVFVTGSSGGDYATIAYSGAGLPLWTNRYDGPENGDDVAKALAVDASGNVFVKGSSFGNDVGWDYATIAYSGAGVPLWTNRYNGLGNGGNYANAVAVDASGNVFVTGKSFSNGGNHDYATMAYSGAGVPLWTNRYDGPANSDDAPTAVAVDGSGNVFVTGSSVGSGGDSDYATIAYSGAGVALWTNRYGGRREATDVANAVAVDASGNVFVTGSSASVGSGDDYATIAYSGAGVALWTNRYSGPANGIVQANALAVAASGNVFVTGSSGYFDGFGFIHDYATVAYSGAGVELWTNRYDGPYNGNDEARAVTVDGSGNVFVTGSSAGSGGYFDYATIAYLGAGVPLWTNRYNGTGNGPDQASAVAVDASGNVFVTGSSGYPAGLGFIHDYATVAYSGAGVPLWTNRYDGPYNGNDEARAVAVDGSGNVFVTGSSAGSGGEGDYLTIAYSGAGVPLWTNRYNGPGNGNDWAETKSSLAIASDGAVYVTGASDGLFSSDFATVKYVWRPEIAIQLLSTIPPKVNLTLSGAPNSSWAIERALEPTGPWTNLSALLIGTNGSAQFQDTNLPSPAGFYRARLQ